jgi:hypothetical protein
MKKFWGYTSNEKFSVGCTGQTVYVYDENGNEVGKFKDITYGYTPMISPEESLFIVKSPAGRLAVYSLETLSLIKKFRFSKLEGAQDDGFCFSPDGKLFLNLEQHKILNVERHKNTLHSAISVYDTTDFSLVSQVLCDEGMSLSHIEFDKSTNAYYVLGFIPDADLDMNRYFVAVYEDDQIKNITVISENEYDFYQNYKNLELMGFTDKAYEWTYIDCELDVLKSMNHTLAKLYMYYNK